MQTPFLPGRLRARLRAAWLLAALLVAALLVAGCVALPAGDPAPVAVTPRAAATTPAADAADATAATGGPGQPVGATAAVATALVSTVDLADLRTATPAPLPATGADVTAGAEQFGERVTLAPGETLALLLPGADWAEPVFDPQVLAERSWTGAVPAGYQAWLFVALSAGETAVRVESLPLPCPPPGGGPCPARPTRLYELSVAVAP
jgi:hypothetical protein